MAVALGCTYTALEWCRCHSCMIIEWISDNPAGWNRSPILPRVAEHLELVVLHHVSPGRWIRITQQQQQQLVLAQRVRLTVA